MTKQQRETKKKVVTAAASKRNAIGIPKINHKAKKNDKDKNKTAATTTTAVRITPQSPANRVGQRVRCWAHSRHTRRRCRSLVTKSREGEVIPIPYCNKHLKSGDGSLQVVNHPFAGKCLVARHDLPAKYRMAFWGIRGKCPLSHMEDRAISFYPPNPKTGKNLHLDDGTRNCNNYNGVLNPIHNHKMDDKSSTGSGSAGGGGGDLIQYAACPGPNERQNMKSTFQYWGKRNGHLGGLEFITLEPVPKGTQLCHWYGAGWWSARGLVRKDVGTSKYPAPLRVKKEKNAKK